MLCRMVNRSVQPGRSKEKSEASSGRYVNPLTATRTQLAARFNPLLQSHAFNSGHLLHILIAASG